MQEILPELSSSLYSYQEQTSWKIILRVYNINNSLEKPSLGHQRKSKACGWGQNWLKR